MNKHITLIGDSIFDNKAYVGKGKSVIEHLSEQQPSGWVSTLSAVDGSITTDVLRQISRIPSETTHIFLSVGGNDALHELSILNTTVRNSAEVFAKVYEVSEQFETQYANTLRSVLGLALPTTVCSIYYPNFDDPFSQKLGIAALATFNDVIFKQAVINKIPLIDLRLVCNDSKDYANSIEPSVGGGQKIAHKIIEVIECHDFANRNCTIYF